MKIHKSHKSGQEFTIKVGYLKPHSETVVDMKNVGRPKLIPRPYRRKGNGIN